MNNILTRVRSGITRNLFNIPGWSSKRRIIVIESDDWGSIRMPSRKVYSQFLGKGLRISDSDYNRLDTLECNDDLNLLYDVLSSFANINRECPVITANFAVGNPDFKKIKESDFRDYYFEPVTETLKRYPGRDKIELLWKKGNDCHLFHPQFHCREHVNIVRWMKALRRKTPEIMLTFDYETTFSGEGDYSFMEVLDYDSTDDLQKMKESLAEGLNLFEKIFGYRSKSFIPPCYTWNSDIEETLNNSGIRYIQGLVAQLIPTGSFGKYGRKYHFLGSINSYGQYYLVRNCFFEPSLSMTSDPIGECLSGIKTAFRWNKPAVISSHRINYMGSLDEKNRSTNLKLLGELLSRIITTWPEVEFMTSDQLGDLISGRKF